MLGLLKNMNLKKISLWLLTIGAIALVIGLVIGLATFDAEEFESQVREAKAIGEDVSEHGCLFTDGYEWCEPKQKCLRSWEEPCE